MQKRVVRIGLVVLIGVMLSACDSLGDKYVSFAQCLTDKGVHMYGAYWCPHCANQKKLFGEEGVAKLTYIECDARGANAQPQLCEQKGIKSYPTWEFQNNLIKTGEQTLEDLSKDSGCALPSEPAPQLPQPLPPEQLPQK